jgi:hypothetical protein
LYACDCARVKFSRLVLLLLLLLLLLLCLQLLVCYWG